MLTAEDIKRTRKALGETQEEFGERFGVNQSTMQRWETLGIPETGTTRMLIERVMEDIVSPGGRKRKVPA